mmetsp:Transcript_26712/g.56867  ORF Transcript_26712/g.56867 Transcript_26712/m.56867 type:complete len:765 (+) Transcript_26712:666-2960(+)
MIYYIDDNNNNMTQMTLDSLKDEAAVTGKRARARTRMTSLVVLALLSAIGAASTAAAAAPRSKSKFKFNFNSISNSNYDSNSNLKLASPSFYSPQNKVVITKSSRQLELEHRLHRLKGDVDDDDDDDRQQQQPQEFITSFYRRKREEHLKTTTAGRANAYDEFGNRRRSSSRCRQERSQTSLCSIHQSAAVRGGAVRSASTSSSFDSSALFGGLGRDRDRDRDHDHHRPRSKQASDVSKSARSPPRTHPSAVARQDAEFPEDVDSTYDDDDDDDDDDDNSGDYCLSSLSGDDSVNGSKTPSSANSGGGLGLLRVPCSIAINSNEDARSHLHHSHSHHHLDHSHHRHHHGSRESSTNSHNSYCDEVGSHGLGHSSFHSHDHHVKKTPIAAYVDTGAQVTVISAAAARRAGILHLMDRRYAGRATGVGHCKVLGRIPARHVYFILGDGGDAAHGTTDATCCWDDPNYEDDYHDDARDHSDDHGSRDSSTVQMEGPALTVLEGTVTQGVDVLLGLDVLQDWEAEIRMGPNKSITVRKRHGRNCSGGGVATDGATTDKLVIPFVNENYGDRNGFLSHSSRRRRHQHLSHRDGQDRRAPSLAPPAKYHNPHHPSANSRSRGVSVTHGSYGMSRRHDHNRHHHHHDHHHGHHHHGHHQSLSLEDEEHEQEAEDDDFSPTASDVESDLDMLEHSSTTCKTASDAILGRASTTPASSSENDLSRGSLDERLFEADAVNDDNVNYDDDDDDYLQEDDDLVDEDDLGDFDMSGL